METLNEKDEWKTELQRVPAFMMLMACDDLDGLEYAPFKKSELIMHIAKLKVEYATLEGEWWDSQGFKEQNRRAYDMKRNYNEQMYLDTKYEQLSKREQKLRKQMDLLHKKIRLFKELYKWCKENWMFPRYSRSIDCCSLPAASLFSPAVG